MFDFRLVIKGMFSQEPDFVCVGGSLGKTFTWLG